MKKLKVVNTLIISISMLSLAMRVLVSCNNGSGYPDTGDQFVQDQPDYVVPVRDSVQVIAKVEVAQNIKPNKWK